MDAIYEALAHIVPDKIRADGAGSRSIIIGGRTTTTGKGYVQYEIIGGGAGARPSKDGMSGTCMNQSNAKIAPVEIIESEFATRLLRFELIRDSGGPGFYRGGLGIRREYLNLADARFSIRSTKHIVPPNGLSGGNPGRTGDIWINPGREGAKRLPTRYADYPLKEGDVFRLDSPGGGGFSDALHARSGQGARRRARGPGVAGGRRARIRRGAEEERQGMGNRRGSDHSTTGLFEKRKPDGRARLDPSP